MARNLHMTRVQGAPRSALDGRLRIGEQALALEHHHPTAPASGRGQDQARLEGARLQYSHSYNTIVAT